MARSKNTNKLSSGFYRAHDFLRFGDVIGSINAGKKGDWRNQARQMAKLQSVNKLGFPFPEVPLTEEQAQESLRAIHGYGVYCNNEYDAWIDSLKFQFESGLLHQVIPPKAILNNFFGDLEVRMPHEQTLLIENHPGGLTFCVRVEETTIRAWMRKYMNVAKLTESLNLKNEKDFWDHLNSAFTAPNPLNEDGKVTRPYEWYEGLDQEVAAIRLTINCNVSETTIEAPETFNKQQLDVMTSNLTTMIPTIYFAPLGKTVEFYDREPAIFFHHNFINDDVRHNELIRSQHHLACAFTQPYTTPGFPVEKSFFEKTFQGSKPSNAFLYPWVENVKANKILKQDYLERGLTVINEKEYNDIKRHAR